MSHLLRMLIPLMIFLGLSYTCFSQASKDSAYYYHQKSQYSQALPFFERAYDTLLQMAAWDTLGIVASKYATALESRGDYYGSFSLLRDTYGYLDTIEGYDATKVMLLNYLAFALSQLAENNVALEVLRESQLLIRSSRLGKTRWTAQNSEYLAIVFNNIQRRDSAVYYLAQAEETYLASLGPSHKIVGLFYNNAATLYSNWGEKNTCKGYFLRALDILIPILGEKHASIGTIYNNLGTVYKDIGDIEKAIEYCSTSIEIAKSSGQIVSEMQASFNLGSYYIILSQYDKGLPLLLRAKDLCVKHVGEDHFFMTYPLDMLSEIHSQKQDFAKALDAARQSMDIKLNYYDDKHPDVVHSYFVMANALQKAGELDSALLYSFQCIAARKELFGPDDLRVAHAYHQVADIYQFRNELNEAEGHYQEALSIYRQNEHNNAWTMDTYTRLGDLSRRKGNYRNALSMYNRGLGALSNDFDITNDDHEVNLQRINNAPNLILCIQGLLQTHFLIFEQDRKKNIYHLDSALLYVDFGLEYLSFETSRALGEETALIWANYSTSFYGFAIQTAYTAYEVTHDMSYLDLAWKVINRTKYQALRWALWHEKAKRFANLPDSILAKEQSLKREINQLRSASYRVDSTRRFELANKQVAYQNFLQQLETDYPRYHELRYQEHAPSRSEIQAALSDSTQLLQYIIGYDFFYVIGIQQDSIFFSKQDIDTTQAYTEWIDSLGIAMRMQDCRAFATYSNKIADLFFIPFVSPEMKEIIIIPDDVLYHLNFEYLILQPSSSCRFDDLDYVIRQHRIRYLYLTEELTPGAVEKHQDRLLAVAPSYASVQAGMRSVSGDSLTSEKAPILTRLPWAGETAKQLGKKFRGHVLTGVEATEQNVKARMADCSILHFGTHAEVNDEEPMLSRLFLAPQNDQDLEDGYLYTHEVYTLPLQASMVSLTACETGLGKIRTGDGMLSLARAFRYAGCPSVAMSLWKIDDQSSAKIMQKFYQFLKQRDPKDVALRRAKLNFLDESTPELANPLYWAGMVIVGDASPIYLSNNVSYWIYLLVLSVILFILYLVMRKRNWTIRNTVK